MGLGSAHAAPIVIASGGRPAALQRFWLGSADHKGEEREAFIQSLVHDHPEVIPMADIAPPFMPLVSVCRELPTSAGFLDNLWVTPDGGIVLGECKLFRNPEARRQVIVQALDYARAVAGLGYEDLEAAARKALGSPSMTLWSLVSDQSTLEQAQFVDAISRRLRQSHFMVLIIGDGIQEGVESLTSYLQLHAGLHVGLALVDLSIWRDSDGRLLVLPRIPLHTVLIERGVVTVGPSGEVKVQPPGTQASLQPSAALRTVTISEQEYFDQLEQRHPGLAAQLRAFLADISNLGIVPEFRKSLVLRWGASPDFDASPGYIGKDGFVWLSSGWNSAKRLGRPQAGEDYLESVAKIVGGHVRRPEKNWPDVTGPNGRQVELSELLKAPEKWKAAIAQLIEETKPTSPAQGQNAGNYDEDPEMKKAVHGKIGEEDLMSLFDPANGVPPIPETQVALHQMMIDQLTDPAQKAAAQAALDARRPIQEITTILYRWNPPKLIGDEGYEN